MPGYDPLHDCTRPSNNTPQYSVHSSTISTYHWDKAGTGNCNHQPLEGQAPVSNALATQWPGDTLSSVVSSLTGAVPSAWPYQQHPFIIHTGKMRTIGIHLLQPKIQLHCIRMKSGGILPLLRQQV